MNRTRVLIIDDSALMRALLTEILSSDPALEVVGTAPDPVAAADRIQRLAPDVLTLDVEMPRMNGLTFLEKLMSTRPMPVVMISALTREGCATTLRALELGAVDFVTKPRIDMARGSVALAQELIDKVKTAALARVRTLPGSAPVPRAAPRPAPGRPASGVQPASAQGSRGIIAIGASTGGTQALVVVLSALPADSPGVVIVQHMPAGYTRAFADRLDGQCAIHVKEAANGDRVVPGVALLAPGGQHLKVQAIDGGYVAHVVNEPPVNLHRPSVDVLFDSVARAAGPRAVGALLTGMGADGARGLLTMRRAGARTVAQDEATSVVFGMPKAAIALGGADEVRPLDQVATALLRLSRARPHAAIA